MSLKIISFNKSYLIILSSILLAACGDPDTTGGACSASIISDYNSMTSICLSSTSLDDLYTCRSDIQSMIDTNPELNCRADNSGSTVTVDRAYLDDLLDAVNQDIENNS